MRSRGCTAWPTESRSASSATGAKPRTSPARPSPARSRRPPPRSHDRMFEHLDDTNPPQPGSRERARVFSRADELVLHRRMLMGLGVAVVVALVAAVPGVLTAAGGNAKRVRTAA